MKENVLIKELALCQMIQIQFVNVLLHAVLKNKQDPYVEVMAKRTRAFALCERMNVNSVRISMLNTTGNVSRKVCWITKLIFQKRSRLFPLINGITWNFTLRRHFRAVHLIRHLNATNGCSCTVTIWKALINSWTFLNYETSNRKGKRKL